MAKSSDQDQEMVYGQVEGELTGLDIHGNPMRNYFTTKSEKALLGLKVNRVDVDWRNKAQKAVTSATQRRSAYIQQVGIVAPPGKACGPCARALGPFGSCKVAIVDGQLHFNGACGNCAWGGAAGRCSFREGPLPLHIHTPLSVANPDNPDLARGSAAKSTKKETKNSTPAPAVPGPATPAGKKRRREVKDEPESADKRARTAERDDGKKPGRKAIPVGPEYDTNLFKSMIRDSTVLKRDWPGIRKLCRVVKAVRDRADWEVSTFEKILVKNGELESPHLSDEAEDGMSVFDDISDSDD